MSAATPRLSETPLVHPRARRRDRRRRGGHARRRALYGRRRGAGAAAEAALSPGVGERMDALAWWDWTHDALRAALADFRALSAEAFLEKYGA